MASTQDISQHSELHTDKFGAQLNWLRAAVLGANDGIVSVAPIVVGVAGVSSNNGLQTFVM